MAAAPTAEGGEGSLWPTAAAAWPLAVGVAASALQLLLWRSRVVARLLEEDARRIWSDGSMMLDCSDEHFQRCVLQSAVDGSSVALESDAESGSTRAGAPRFYQSGSSSGVTSESDTESAPNVNGGSPPRTPQRMAKQVGGIASHKRPVLALGDFILKPLRLLGRSHVAAGKNAEGDRTKTHRGIREVAFYEALKFASALPSDIGHSSAILTCRHPCVGYHGSSRYLNYDSALLQTTSGISLLQNLGYFDTMALLVAHYAGDSRVLSCVQTHANAWRSLANEMKALKSLSRFTAPYFGVLDLDCLEGRRHLQSSILQPLHRPHLLLRNLAAPYRRPNIIDIKMGKQTYEPSAPLSKQRREAGKYPQQVEFGFRIVGMRVCSPTSSTNGEEYQCWGKSFGVGLKTRDEVIRALTTFFCAEESSRSAAHALRVLSSVIVQLAELMKWFREDNSTLAFYASSILIVYNGSEPSVTTDGGYREPVLKMIDFAHVVRQSGGDPGYLNGLGNLSGMLEDIKRHGINLANSTQQHEAKEKRRCFDQNAFTFYKRVPFSTG